MHLSQLERILKLRIENFLDRMAIYRSRKREIRKLRDPRRVKIYSKVLLTDQQKAEIDRVYKENYGEKIPHTWHRHFTAYTGKFDPFYFPELLFIPEFERFMNQEKSYTKVFSDKTVLPLIASAVGVEITTPKTYLSAVRGILRDQNNDIISRAQAVKILEGKKAFFKPTVDSNSGRGCMIVNVEGGIDKISGRKMEDIFGSAGKDFIIQECITCHPSIQRIYSQSVNTFRIITYLWKGCIEHVPVIMRIGQGGSFLDNAHAGGMFVAVSDEGVLHKQAFTEFRQMFTQHPDTDVVFEGYKIENFPKVIEAAKKMHCAIPQVGCINWDFTIDEAGNPVLIEGNMRSGSVWLIEMAHGCGAFGDKTPDVLRWIRLCKKTPAWQRGKYAYGSMSDSE